jgi:hypothetical protein
MTGASVTRTADATGLDVGDTEGSGDESLNWAQTGETQTLNTHTPRISPDLD